MEAPQVGIAHKITKESQENLAQEKIDINSMLEAIRNEAISFVSFVSNRLDEDDNIAKEYINHLNILTGEIFNKINN